MSGKIKKYNEKYCVFTKWTSMIGDKVFVLWGVCTVQITENINL